MVNQTRLLRWVIHRLNPRYYWPGYLTGFAIGALIVWLW